MYAICHITGCDNATTPIDVGDVHNIPVVCGVCSQPITDLTDIPPTLPEELPPWEI